MIFEPAMSNFTSSETPKNSHPINRLNEYLKRIQQSFPLVSYLGRQKVLNRKCIYNLGDGTLLRCFYESGSS